jgi:hypothetical protein
MRSEEENKKSIEKETCVGVVSIVSTFKNIFERVGLNSSFQVLSSLVSLHSKIKVNSRSS